MSRIFLFPRQSRLSRAVSGVLAILALGAVAPAWAAGASDTAATAAGAAAPLTITVQPGQSLNDIAIAATQSHDPGVIARAGRALFDANPQAFMKRDPSRLKLGAALTVPALDATGAAIASGASAASVTTAASAGAASAPHPASAAHAASAVQGAPAASAVHPAQASDAHAAAATAGASAAVGASAAHGASGPGAEPAAQQAGASGPHVWSGSIQAAPSSASEAVASSTPGVPAAGSHAAPGAAPVAAASQARPSSLQQLLALKNRVLMELQKHGIGKSAATGAAADAGRPQAPSAPRPAAGDAGASVAAPGASEAAATGGAASAVQPQTPPVRPVTTTGAAGQVDWRPVAVAGAAAALLVAGFMWRKRRNARRGAAEAASGADDVKPSIVEALPIQPETPVSRDAAADVHLAAATAETVETVEAHEAHDAQVASPSAEPGHADSTPHAQEAGEVAQAADAVHDEQPADTLVDAPANAPAEKPIEAPAHAPADAPAAPAADTQQALMQSAIAALDSLDMPLPPRVSDEASLSTTEPAPKAGLFVDDKGATNGQSASRPPVGANDQTPEHLAEQEEEPEWDGGATLHGRSGATSSAPAFAPLGGAQFGALKLDFDLDLPAAPGAAPPALTPDELARIARNKLELAGEYVELGDLAGARTLLQEVIDANDAATRDDARALLAKLADEA
ncbi:FimV/HubP family polar landmark protein [Burkholderia ubonensis]|uniref:Pilus assembly protein FimV n=1 Tax=Burkholderia ubonensis TaxID=101571 RepID=A0AB74DF27_9BURK|nr:FimV/HubP family polar landmark protein [Burkholderia ubonensis]PAJ78768.1 pilus assembly protein FimV [Burkholderia ubonensis]PAJ89905.1 pilus assembly protein FimV [Burkholderia ubonensis]PAJ96464.1 pilus assembly protein FimV [Burkholderia ubonensis]PAK02803.1 pilus assembly protein FimV [Burkholderia ubonensis]PAK07442.1 pilus assembly protein FimV [Burkholderia ubonensis]